MSKSIPKKNSGNAADKAPAAYAAKDKKPANPSKDNPSKYGPGTDTDLTVQQLDPEDGLLKLFTDSIKDLYWAENQIVKALPKMIKASGTEALKDALSNHLAQTEIHVGRLEKVFELLGKKVQAKKCDAMEGLTKEGEGVIEDTDSGSPARDIGVIMASQKVEHYEIAAYTGLINLATKLGLEDISKILSETLTEEQASDETLSGIADEILSAMSASAGK